MACQTPEERATGDEHGSRDDSIKNSPPKGVPSGSADTSFIHDNTTGNEISDTSLNRKMKEQE